MYYGWLIELQYQTQPIDKCGAVSVFLILKNPFKGNLQSLEEVTYTVVLKKNKYFAGSRRVTHWSVNWRQTLFCKFCYKS